MKESFKVGDFADTDFFTFNPETMQFSVRIFFPL